MQNEETIRSFLNQYGFDEQYLGEIKKAFYHSSYVNETTKNIESNERLEFLGDSVLNLIVADYIFSTHAEMDEGKMTKLRAQLVREESLVLYAAEINLAAMLYLGKGEELSGGRERHAILADAFEALIASLYKVYGFEPVKSFLYQIFMPIVEQHRYEEFDDFKSRLQELVQADRERNVNYRVLTEDGPSHSKEFVVEVYVDDIPFGQGRGRSKKEAEQKAAEQALHLLAK